jgi:peptidoglycan/LPS O-acetylase OafA/YrhL
VGLEPLFCSNAEQPAVFSVPPDAEVTAPSSLRTSKKRLDIQGMRAIAVVLVVLFHAGIPGVGGGYVGVDVFFVISGFLISTHLLEALRDRGGIEFGAFYARRVRRLLPAAFTVIVLTVAAAAVWASPVQFESVIRDAIAATCYVPNVLFAFNATDYLADKTPSLFMHYWSLGVEEQFYLLWPALLLGLFKLRSSRMVAAFATVIAASFVLCVWLTAFSQPTAFFTLFARIWEFGLGGLVALALLGRGRIFGQRTGVLLGWAGLAAIVASGMLFSTATDYPGYAVAVPVVGAALLIAAGPVRWGPAAFLSVRPLTWIGDISYSLYLVHWPLLVLPVAANGYMHTSPMWLRVAIVAACVPLAWLLYTYVEQPGQRTVWLSTAHPRRTLAVTAAAMAAVSAVALTVGVVQNPVLDAGRPALRTPLSLKPVGTPYVPNNLTPQLSAAADDVPVTYANGCHRSEWSTDPTGCVIGTNPRAPLVVLFGDSHAAHWHPALSVLADQGLIRLDNHTKSDCPPEEIYIPHYPRCDVWRQGVLGNIAASKPSLILLGSWGSDYLQDDDDPKTHWREALASTLSKFPRESRVAVFADTPSIGVPPSFCLSLFVNDAQRCALPRSKAFSKPARQARRRLAADGAFTLLDYSNYLCDDTVCPSILGDTLVYRDGNHLTVQESTELAPLVDADVMSILGVRRGSTPDSELPSRAATSIAGKQSLNQDSGVPRSGG